MIPTEIKKQFYPTVTNKFHVDINAHVYDEMGRYYMHWKSLSIKEQNIVLQNPKSVFPMPVIDYNEFICI
jgi:hypothetical protein